ncbi:MAG: prolipoprotein diacylglyceryl transferase [bacterium]|nr:prolipoprotein diacylglyceryl transferase [bacterium]
MYPILFSLGPVHIYSFGVFLALAFVSGSFYVWRESRNEFGEEIMLDTLVMTAILAFLGARLFYILSHFSNFDFNFLRWIHLYLYPGFSFWGGVLGGVLGAFWFTKKKTLPFGRVMDFLVLGAGLGQIFGQIGCFLNGCTVGKVTNLSWGMPVIGFLGKRHPVALYDALGALVIFLITLRVYLWIFRQKRERSGRAGLTYLTLLALFSFPLEFFKEGGVYFYTLSLNQWVAVIFVIGTGIFWLSFLKDPRRVILGPLGFIFQRLKVLKGGE